MCASVVLKGTCPGPFLFQSTRQPCPISCGSLAFGLIWNKDSTWGNSCLKFVKCHPRESVWLHCTAQAWESIMFEPGQARNGRGWWGVGLLDRILGISTGIAARSVPECHAVHQYPPANRADCTFTESSFKCCHLAQSTHLQKRKCLLGSKSDHH